MSERDLVATMPAEEKFLGEIVKAVRWNSSPEYRLYLLSHRAHGRDKLRKKLANSHTTKNEPAF